MPSSTVLIGAAPKETALLGKDGRINEVWLAWFASITATGTIVQNVQTLQTIAEDNSTDANTSAILAEVLDAILLLAETRRAPDPVDDYSFIPNPRPAADEPIPADAPSNAWRAECDELRALIAAGDPAPFGALGSVLTQFGGVSGTITIPKLTTANGSITVTNGVITAFVNPT